MVAVGETDCEPAVDSVPVQPPEAVQEVAFVADQLNVEDWPELIVVGLAEKVRVGGGFVEPTVTVTDLETVPPEP